MKKNDLIPAIILMVLGIAVAVGSYRLKLGNLTNPGPGLMPFLLGITLSGCSLVILFQSFFIMMRKTKQGNESIWLGVDFKRIILVIGLLVGYAILLEKVGFGIMTFLLLLILFKTLDSQKWSPVLITSVLIVLITYLLFVVFLKVELPPGLLGRIG